MSENIQYKNKCVFLDRDGVINQPIIINKRPYSPRKIKEFIFTTDIKNLVTKVANLGYKVIVITNQPDIATGDLSESLLNHFHKRIINEMPIDDIFVCKHLSSDNCNCRKPNPGLIIKAVSKHKINLEKSYFIGDRWKDVDAANKVKCHTIFIDYGYTEKLKTIPKNCVTTLKEAFDIILKKEIS